MQEQQNRIPRACMIKLISNFSFPAFISIGSSTTKTIAISIKKKDDHHLATMDAAASKEAGRKNSMVVGTWGGNGGTSWDDGCYNGVREITLVYGRCIDSIRIVYDKNGKPVASEKHGGTGGHQTAEIKLQYPEEFIVSVSGHYSPVVHGGSPVIRSLTFKTNRRTFGPFGIEEGTPFIFSGDGCLIIGFKGRSGWFLDALGFYLYRIQKPKLYQKVQKQLKKLATMSASPKPSTPNEYS